MYRIDTPDIAVSKTGWSRIHRSIRDSFSPSNIFSSKTKKEAEEKVEIFKKLLDDVVIILNKLVKAIIPVILLLIVIDLITGSIGLLPAWIAYTGLSGIQTAVLALVSWVLWNYKKIT